MSSIKTPEFLFDSYKAYKRDTQDVASWLAETARNCRQGQLGKSKVVNDAPTTSSPKLWEIVPLARNVSETDSSIEVPRSILSSLKSLIRKRKRCNGWFSGQAGDESHEMQNQSHDRPYHSDRLLKRCHNLAMS